MIIDFDKKNVFILNPKCASRIIYRSIRFDRTNTQPIFVTKNLNHLQMKDIVIELKKLNFDPKEFDYYILIRHPYERLISYLKFNRFDKNWKPIFGRGNDYNFLYDFSKDNIEKYKLTEKPYSGCFNYNIDQYVKEGYEKSKMFMNHPKPLNEMLILNEDYKIHIYKLEELNIFCDFLISENYIKKYISEKINVGNYDKEKELSELTQESKDIIHEIFKEDFKYY